MKPPSLHDLPAPPPARTGWPWTIGAPAAPPAMPDGRPWPRVTVVIPSFNQGAFLEETVRSVLLQGYPDLDCIVMDGGSTDGSVGIIRKYAPWLAHWESAPDRGQAHAINRGWERAAPGVWAWLNSDDLYLPGAVLKSIGELEADPGAGLLYSCAAFIDANGNLTKRMYDARGLGPGVGRMKFWIRWPVPQPTVFMKSSVIDRHGPLDESFRYAMDYELLVRLTRTERAAFSNEVRALYRIHDSSKTGGWETTRSLFADECRRANAKNATLREKIVLAAGPWKSKDSPRSAAGFPLPLERQIMIQQSTGSGLHVVHFSRFPSLPSGDGGVRRMIQIRDLLNELAPVSISCADGDLADEPIALPGSGAGGMDRDRPDFADTVTGGDYRLWAEGFRDDLLAKRIFAWQCVGAVPSMVRPDLAIVDDPIYFLPLVDHLNDLGIPIIALEQNIETMVPGQVVAAAQMEALAREIACYRKCGLVICVSHEDAVFLKNFGVNTVMLPYYPNARLREPFEKIRAERARGGLKKGFLLLGSAYNAPTGAGMYELAKKWNASPALAGHVLHIAGYGTEMFRDMAGAAGPAVQVLGQLSDDELARLLSGIGACIIFQEDGTGALTKICELLIAGVPVLANHHAARSYHNVPGVTEFDDFAALERMIAGGLVRDEALPVPPAPDAGPVLRAVRELAAGLKPRPDIGPSFSDEAARLREKAREAAARQPLAAPLPPGGRERIADDFANMYGNLIGRLLLWPPYALYRVYRKYIKKRR